MLKDRWEVQVYSREGMEDMRNGLMGCVYLGIFVGGGMYSLVVTVCECDCCM